MARNLANPREADVLPGHLRTDASERRIVESLDKLNSSSAHLSVLTSDLPLTSDFHPSVLPSFRPSAAPTSTLRSSVPPSI